MSITRALAEWSTNVDSAACQAVYGLARNAFINIAACMIAGAGDESVRRSFAAVAGLGAGPGTMVGLEVMACIENTVNLEHYERGWHSTSTQRVFCRILSATLNSGRNLKIVPAMCFNQPSSRR